MVIVKAEKIYWLHAQDLGKMKQPICTNPFLACFVRVDILRIYLQFLGQLLLGPAGGGPLFTQTTPERYINLVAVFDHDPFPARFCNAADIGKRRLPPRAPASGLAAVITGNPSRHVAHLSRPITHETGHVLRPSLVSNLTDAYWPVRVSITQRTPVSSPTVIRLKYPISRTPIFRQKEVFPHSSISLSLRCGSNPRALMKLDPGLGSAGEVASDGVERGLRHPVQRPFVHLVEGAVRPAGEDHID